jgi:hypothetical protein
MVFSDQALDIHRAQRDLVALRLTQPRRSKRCRIGPRLRLLRQVPKQFIGSHHCPRESVIATESHNASHRLYLPAKWPKHSQPLRMTAFSLSFATAD